MARGHYASQHYASRHYASQHYGAPVVDVGGGRRPRKRKRRRRGVGYFASVALTIDMLEDYLVE